MDDLERHIREREKDNPGFAKLVAAARERRAFMRRMAGLREAQGLTQTQVAASMKTSAAAVSRIESGADVQLSTLERYMTAIGQRLELKGVASRKPKKPRPLIADASGR